MEIEKRELGEKSLRNREEIKRRLKRREKEERIILRK